MENPFSALKANRKRTNPSFNVRLSLFTWGLLAIYATLLALGYQYAPAEIHNLLPYIEAASLLFTVTVGVSTYLIARETKTESLYRIDEERAANKPEMRILELESRLEELTLQLSSMTPERGAAFRDILQSYQDKLRATELKLENDEKQKYTSYSFYAANVIRVLEDGSIASDAKASKLLDRGMAYTKFGIAFYIAAILSWQILVWNKGFKPELLYGMGSCTVLFIFIEFLSAWFLKQYRQYVDSSLYLTKVKALFDRYLLLYLLGRVF